MDGISLHHGWHYNGRLCITFVMDLLVYYNGPISVPERTVYHFIMDGTIMDGISLHHGRYITFISATDLVHPVSSILFMDGISLSFTIIMTFK